MPSFFEYTFLNRLLLQLQNNNILSEIQNEFRNEKSTMSAIYSFYERLIELIDSGEYPLGICCDLSRVFDYVDYNKFLMRIKKMVLLKNHLSGLILFWWIENYVFLYKILTLIIMLETFPLKHRILFILFIKQFDSRDYRTLFVA